MAYVLFMDIVSYSLLPMDEQQRILAELQDTVRNSTQVTCAQADDKLIALPTGDGMALVFFGCPDSPVTCALELTHALRHHPEIKLRMGIHAGPVYRVADINANRNVAGGGITMAQRVMDCGDEGHILISNIEVDVLAQLSTWKNVMLQDLGEAEVKHGVRIRIYNLYTNEVGNRELPHKLQAARDAAAAARAKVKWRKLALIAVLLVIAVIVVGIEYLHPSFHARSRTEPYSKFAISQVTDTGLASVAAISPDGRFILNVQNDNGQQSLWLRNVPSGSDTQIIPPAPVMYRSLNFSPDGNYIYFQRGMGRTPNLLDEFRAPLLGGEPQMVVHDIDTNVSFSPDGSRMAFFRDNNPSAGRMRLISTSVDGKDEKILLEAKLYSAYLVQPAWSPDGKEIAFTEDFAEGALGRVQLLDLTSGRVRTLYSTKDAEFLSLAWAGSSHSIAVVYSSKSSGLRQGQIGLISYPGGSFRPLTNDTTSYAGAHMLAPVSASASGREIVAVQNKGTARIELMSLGAGVASDLKEIMSVHGSLGGLSWTPDGKILYARRNRLMLVNENGSEETVFTADPSMPMSDPNVCRDGRHIVFIWRFHDGTVFKSVSRVDIDGSNAMQLTFGDDYFAPRCSPDSQEVAFQDQNNKQLKMPLSGGTPEVFMREWNISGLSSWSPDGNKISLVTTVRNQKGAYENKVVIYSFDSHTKQYLPCNPNFSGVDSIQFTPDGKSVACVIREKRGDNIWVQPLDGSAGHAITNFPDDSIYVFRFSPDGKHLALIHGHTESDVVLIRDANGRK
jgi:Tol biopolymer transport system component/class 3 adenylate cyclase